MNIPKAAELKAIVLESSRRKYIVDLMKEASESRRYSVEVESRFVSDDLRKELLSLGYKLVAPIKLRCEEDKLHIQWH